MEMQQNSVKIGAISIQTKVLQIQSGIEAE